MSSLQPDDFDVDGALYECVNVRLTYTSSSPTPSKFTTQLNSAHSRLIPNALFVQDGNEQTAPALFWATFANRADVVAMLLEEIDIDVSA